MTHARRLLLMAPLAATLPFLGCAAGGTPGVTDDEVVFGITAPLSGPAAAWGALGLGAEAWADHVNAEGGVNGRRIRVLMKDDAYTPGRAVANVSEMDEEVLALVGMVGTAVINAVKDQVAESGLPLVMPTGNVRVWADQPRDRIRRVFVAYPDYRSEGAFLGEQMAAAAGVETAAAFYQNDDYGRDFLEGLERGLAEAGVELKVSVPYELQDRELGLHALQIRDAGAEAVALFSTPTHAANLVNEMAKLEYHPVLFGPSPLSDEKVMFKLLGEGWSGAYYSSFARPAGDPVRTRIESTILAQDPSLEDRMLLALAGAAGMMVSVEALREAGPEPTRESFVAALESVHLDDVFVGPIAFAPDRRHGYNGAALFRVPAPGQPVEVVVGARTFPALF